MYHSIQIIPYEDELYVENVPKNLYKGEIAEDDIPYESAGVTWSLNHETTEDNDIVVSGEATGMSYCRLFISKKKRPIPKWMEPGKMYRIEYSSEAVRFQILDTSSEYPTVLVDTLSNTTFKVPRKMKSCEMRFAVFYGVSVDETVHFPKIFAKNDVAGIKLNGINTWEDWHLIPSSRPLFNPPKVKTSYIDLPGAHGSIDATQMLSNEIYYQNREGSNEFYVMNGFGHWATRFSEAMDYLHGRKVKVVLPDDDPGFYYIGRMAVNQWKSEKDYSKIVFDYNLEPYKYETRTTIEDWLWDPFNFYNGIIRKKGDYTNIVINAHGNPDDPIHDAVTVEIPINNVRSMTVIPTIHCTVTEFGWRNIDETGYAQTTLTIAVVDSAGVGKGVHVEKFESQYEVREIRSRNIVVKPGQSTLRLTASPDSILTVSIEYRGGML